MKQPTFTGIGCYAKPERLSRIFKKLAQDYALGPFKGSQLFDGPVSKEIESIDLLQALMAGQRPDTSPQACKGSLLKDFDKIRGFYLTMNEQGLNLSIFAKSNSCQPEIITTRLDGLTKLRQKRLH
jgi:hypothetical protein